MIHRKTQLEWTELSVSVLEDRAKEAGLLGQEERLVYTPPTDSGRVAAKITVYVESSPAIMNHYWLPSFRPKDTNRDVERICDAQGRILYAMILQGRFTSAIDATD